MNNLSFRAAASIVLNSFVKMLNNATYEISTSGLLEKAIIYCKTGRIFFFYAPPEFHVEIFIRLNNGEEYDFASLMSIPEIASWVNENKLKIDCNTNKIIAELEWFVVLLSQLKKNIIFKSLLD